jgi:hypothetical protein
MGEAWQESSGGEPEQYVVERAQQVHQICIKLTFNGVYRASWTVRRFAAPSAAAASTAASAPTAALIYVSWTVGVSVPKLGATAFGVKVATKAPSVAKGSRVPHREPGSATTAGSPSTTAVRLIAYVRLRTRGQG